MKLARSYEDLRRLAGGRSVYSDMQLRRLAATEARPVKVINFLLAAHLEPPVPLANLLAGKVFAGHPPQSIKALIATQQMSVLQQGSLGFTVSADA